MARRSIKKNYIFNLSYQVLLLMTPLVTTPYLSRVIGADGVGTVSFAESVVSYFVLFATLGITTFGQREISYVQDDVDKRSQVFWEAKCLEFLTSGMALAIYIPFILFQPNRLIYLFLAFNILAVFFDVTWFFQGMEEFGKIVLRNCFFKVVNIIYIFLFVKTKADVVKYAFGLAFLLFGSNISLWLYLPKYIKRPIWGNIKPFRNIKVVISLFIPTIAIQVYTVLDKTMIGIITQNAYENGYYEQALKISKMTLAIVTALGTVMIPRIGYHYGRGETEKVNEYMYRGYRFVWFLGIPLCFGLIGTASNFVPWFFGDGYEKVIPLLGILSFLIIAIGISNVTGIQYLIPTKREIILTKTVIVGAVINFGLNMGLIYWFKSTGAAVASVTAEISVSVVQLYIIRKELSVKRIIVSSWHYLVAGVCMLVTLILLNSVLSSTILHTLVMITIGTMVYFAILVVFRDDFFISNSRKAIDKVSGMIRKRNP